MIEIIATVMGLIQGVLVWANKRANWIFYCLQYIFMGIFSIQNHLYGDLTNSAVYFLVGVAGWFLWNKGSKMLKIKRCTGRERIAYIAALTVGTGVLYFILKPTNDPLPLLDSFTTVSGYVATYLMLTKKTDTWVIWFINDMFYIAEYCMLPNQAWYLMGLNVIWTAMAVGSFITWRREALKNEENILCGKI